MPLNILIFSLLFWFGLYLITRDLRSPHLRFAGISLIAYTLGLACTILSPYSPTPSLELLLTRLSWLLSVLALLPLFGALYLLWRLRREIQPGKAWRILFASLLLFLLGTVLLLFPQSESLRTWILLVMGIDLLILGGMIAIVDAVDQGEALLPDIFRSFDFSFGTVILFAGQVVLIILLATGLTFPMLVLLLTIIATAIVVQAFWKQMATLIDQMAFAYFPQIRQARAELRNAATTLTRVNSEIDFETLDEAEFTRLTRRALSHFGDLSRLATSPLTYLPIVEMRLAKQEVRDNALGRVIELKSVLVESIARLKPQNKGDFGTSDEWRYYNALYFPYVVGLKPYSKRAQNGHLDPVAQKALEWFRTMVPERTLHNWQNAATRLVAQELRSKSF